MSDMNSYDQVSRDFLTEKISEKLRIKEDLVKASDLSDDTLSDMYNRVSKAEKIACYVAVPAGFAFMATLFYGAFGGDTQSTAFLVSGVLSFVLGFGAGNIADAKRNNVKKEITNAANERLIELDQQQQKISPRP